MPESWIVGGEGLQYNITSNVTNKLPVSLQFKTEDLWTYFDNLHDDKIPSFEHLFEMAKSLWKSYSSPGAVTSLVTGHHFDKSIVRIGEPWRKEEDVDYRPVPGKAAVDGVKDEEGKKDGEEGIEPPNKKEFRGDRSLARSVAFMYEALVSKEVAQAVAEGDIGRVYEGIKVSTHSVMAPDSDGHCR